MNKYLCTEVQRRCQCSEYQVSSLLLASVSTSLPPSSLLERQSLGSGRGYRFERVGLWTSHYHLMASGNVSSTSLPVPVANGDENGGASVHP